jgi:hypothetical protein
MKRSFFVSRAGASSESLKAERREYSPLVRAVRLRAGRASSRRVPTRSLKASHQGLYRVFAVQQTAILAGYRYLNRARSLRLMIAC